MLVDLRWIKDNYNKFNGMYWNGELPIPTFKITMSKKSWGRASYLINRRTRTLHSFTLSISNYMDSPEKVKLNTLLHEMIHIADYHYHPEHFTRRRRYNSHGPEFFGREAARINRDGWNISARVTDEESNASKLSEKAAEKIAAKKKEQYYVLVGSVKRKISSVTGKAYDFTVIRPVGGIPTKDTYRLAENLGMHEIILLKTAYEKYLFTRGRSKSGIYATRSEIDEMMSESEVILTASDLKKFMKAS